MSHIQYQYYFDLHLISEWKNDINCNASINFINILLIPSFSIRSWKINSFSFKQQQKDSYKSVLLLWITDGSFFYSLFFKIQCSENVESLDAWDKRRKKSMMKLHFCKFFTPTYNLLVQWLEFFFNIFLWHTWTHIPHKEANM